MSSGRYVLLASVFYQRQEDGRRKRFTKGDEVELSDDKAARLLKAGAVAPVEKAKPKVEEPADTDERPKQVAPKADWVDWAVSQGADRAEAEEMTKADLIAEFG